MTRDGRSLGTVLMEEGLAETWTGRRRDWCLTFCPLPQLTGLFDRGAMSRTRRILRFFWPFFWLAVILIGATWIVGLPSMGGDWQAGTGRFTICGQGGGSVTNNSRSPLVTFAARAPNPITGGAG